MFFKCNLFPFNARYDKTSNDSQCTKVEKKQSFPPFLPKQLARSGWKYFYEEFSQIRVRAFFLKCRSCKIWQPLQNSYHEKVRFFDSVFSIRPRLTYVDSIFQRKTNTHLDWVVVSTKKFHLDKIESRCLRGWKFWLLGTSKTARRRHLGILSLWQPLLYSSRSIHPVSFINFLLAIP